MAVAEEPVLDLTFDDPDVVLGAYSEGASRTEYQADPKLERLPVSSGSGGEAFLREDTSNWDAETVLPPRIFQVVTDPVVWAKPFVRLTSHRLQREDDESPGTGGRLEIVPEGQETSFAGFAEVKDGKIFLNGAFDVFFRYEEKRAVASVPVPHLISLIGDGRLRMFVESDSEGLMAARILAEKAHEDDDNVVFDTDLDGEADEARAETTLVNAVPIGTDPYHLAVTFQTDDEGTVTVRVYVKQGSGEIHTESEDNLASEGRFRILSKDEGLKFTEKFKLGPQSRQRADEIVLDLAAFRIFDTTPKVFPALPGAPTKKR